MVFSAASRQRVAAGSGSGAVSFCVRFGLWGGMQTQNPFLDEMAKLTQAAMGLAQAAGEEAKSAFRAQSDKWAADLDLIRREEYVALKAVVASLRAEIAGLKAASKTAKDN
jgi:BMFP domain-containing protein YqiC